MKKLIILSVSLIVLAGSSYSEPAENEILTDTQEVIVRVKEEPTQEIEFSDEDAPITKKATSHKKGKKQILVKFLVSMLGVGISSVIIFLILLGYKKFSMPKGMKLQETDEKSLESPKSFKEAVNLFLDKTKWD